MGVGAVSKDYVLFVFLNGLAAPDNGLARPVFFNITEISLGVLYLKRYFRLVTLTNLPGPNIPPSRRVTDLLDPLSYFVVRVS